MINVKVGNRLRELRKLKGLSQEALADECGLDRTYITYIENAKKSMTISTLYKITSALKITLEEFFSFEEGDVLIKMNNVLELPETGLKVIVTPKTEISNTKVYEDELEVNNLVKQYFDESIYSYYFFDGENLKNYFEKSNTKRIKDLIFNISQVTLLANAMAHLDVIKKKNLELFQKHLIIMNKFILILRKWKKR